MGSVIPASFSLAAILAFVPDRPQSAIAACFIAVGQVTWQARSFYSEWFPCQAPYFGAKKQRVNHFLWVCHQADMREDTLLAPLNQDPMWQSCKKRCSESRRRSNIWPVRLTEKSMLWLEMSAAFSADWKTLYRFLRFVSEIHKCPRDCPDPYHSIALLQWALYSWPLSEVH